ncbi:hypothetical protein [uncultured Methanobrevibacter sp.]|uniref:hypothetical protein n=1 Tax=uncultured Methanobrevibacter sp. TaxID=253161 RepID=UPI0025DA6192|nr:hypothetical protein [uncultured Methanobrevibacter sp.]
MDSDDIKCLIILLVLFLGIPLCLAFLSTAEYAYTFPFYLGSDTSTTEYFFDIFPGVLLFMVVGAICCYLANN